MKITLLHGCVVNGQSDKGQGAVVEVDDVEGRKLINRGHAIAGDQKTAKDKPAPAK